MSCRSTPLVSRRVNALRQIDGWPTENATAGVVRDGERWTHGPASRSFRWASVTKPVTALAALVAAEEGIVDLDEPAGPQGSTLRHLLAHASGLPFEGDQPIGRPGQRRIYSNTGFELLASFVAERAEMAFDEYVQAAVLDPLEMRDTRLEGSPASGLEGPLEDLLAFAEELLDPRLVAAETLEEATSVAFPGLSGVLPDMGRYDPNDWGLGFELRDAKSPHWTGIENSGRTFGHFGGSGSFLWVDPEPAASLATLGDLDFGDWAKEAWPALSDAVVGELSRTAA
jgi:CubicO group peptidase (beta-lactamase class C family)